METFSNGRLDETGKKVQQAGQELKKTAGKISNEAMHRFEDVATSVQDVVHTKLNQLSDSAVAYRASAEGQVRKHPLSWVLGAACVGIAFGVAFSFIRPLRR